MLVFGGRTVVRASGQESSIKEAPAESQLRIGSLRVSYLFLAQTVW